MLFQRNIDMQGDGYMNKIVRSKKIIAFDILVIGILLYFCFFTKNISKPLLVLIFLFTLSFFLYQDILKQMFLKCNRLLLNQCDTITAEQLLYKFEKIDVLKLYREHCFILKCYLILDNYKEADFTKFINQFNGNRLQMNKSCNLTFNTMLLQYFFFTKSKAQYISLYQKISTQQSTSKLCLTPYYHKLLSILQTSFEHPDSQLLKQLHNLLKDPHTKREEIYIYLFSGFICKEYLGMDAEFEEYINKANSLSDKFTLIKTFQTAFCGKNNENN